MAGNGGIIGPTNRTSFGKNKVTIKTSGSSTITTGANTRLANVVVVGGGGGGGGTSPSPAGCGGGGGGAGGVVLIESLVVTGSTGYPVSVGGGGAVATAGSDSTGFCVTGKGGGFGGAYLQPQVTGSPGGSGGGGGGNNPGNAPYCSVGGCATQPTQPGDSGTFGFGNAGAKSYHYGGEFINGGGGGGACAVGNVWTPFSPFPASGPTTAGVGGTGKNLATIISTSLGVCGVIGGGGGGGSHGPAPKAGAGGAGGPGGGGKGGNTSSCGSPTVNAVAGTANTGGGGGGKGGGSTTAAAGGSGVVAIKELSKASGVWSMSEQLDARADGTWVLPPVIYTGVDFMVVAGGGGGSGNAGGGGGAGGYRASGYGPSPLRASALSIEEGDYTITVGAGGTGNPFNSGTATNG
jgi:hypothetical protein